jgi:murein L,D-transpeptidase YcbB/YkuD
MVALLCFMMPSIRRKGPETTMKLPSCLLVLLGLAAGLPFPAPAQQPTVTDVRDVIAAARLPWSRWPDFSRQVDDVARLYRGRAGAPVWLEAGAPGRPAGEAMAQLAAASAHGLAPGDYDAGVLDSLGRTLRAVPGGAAAMRFDLLLTVAFVRFIADLHAGRAPHAPLSRTLPDPPLDLAASVSAALAGDSVPRLAEAVAPRMVQYQNLRATLARYRVLAGDSSIPLVPVVERLNPDDPYDGAPALAGRLAALGDLRTTIAPASESRYAGDLVEAIRRFQRRHGLTADGVVGPLTFRALNTPLAHRVRQIELTLERLRWLPPLVGHRMLVVNIPAFRLFAFDSVGGTGVPTVHMRVIVGKALDTRTPVLVEQLRYLEFQPYWNVPRSILTQEILPQLRRRPTYLREHDMELVGPRDRVVGDAITPAALERLASGELRLRQRPSPRNPLGRVKFVFPNTADVYLHGTPDTALFAQKRRDFSHGCIRVERPGDLAAWVLGDQLVWPRDSVAAAMAAQPTRRALLSRPMPVVLFYATALALPGVGMAFYEDIYGHDRRLDEALRAGRTPP